MVDIILEIILGFVIVMFMIIKFGESSFEQNNDKMTTNEIIEELEKNELKNKNNDNKLFYLGLGALIGINLFD